MGVMKRVLLFSLMMIIAGFTAARASMTVEQSTDAEYLINSGYSQVMAEDVFISKNRANGATIEPLYEKSQNRFVRAWRAFYSYLDPAQETVDRIHHDVRLAPHHSDL